MHRAPSHPLDDPHGTRLRGPRVDGPAGARDLARSARIRRGEDEALASGRGEATLPHGAGHDAREHEVNALGMTLFLASLTMIFGASLAAFGIFRWKEGGSWSGTETQRDIVTIVLATVVLVACDVLSTRARGAHADRLRALRLTRAALWLAVGYMVVQSWNWWSILQTMTPALDGPRLSMETTLFLMLTFTHAVHVLGGIIADAVVVHRSRKDGVGPRRASLELLFRYWRFLTVVWFVLVAVIVAT